MHVRCHARRASRAGLHARQGARCAMHLLSHERPVVPCRLAPLNSTGPPAWLRSEPAPPADLLGTAYCVTKQHNGRTRLKAAFVRHIHAQAAATRGRKRPAPRPGNKHPPGPNLAEIIIEIKTALDAHRRERESGSLAPGSKRRGVGCARGRFQSYAEQLSVSPHSLKNRSEIHASADPHCDACRWSKRHHPAPTDRPR
jgi:hypothetical protein